MWIDLTLALTSDLAAQAQDKEKRARVGHLGTHLDAMGKAFPLDYLERSGVAFDVSHVRTRDIAPADIDASRVRAGMFVAFHTGFLNEAGYATPRYFHEHPQLSQTLIDLLLERGVSLIGIDCAGVRRGSEHTKTDRLCAERGVFVVENLVSLDRLCRARDPYTIHTYPMRYEGASGLPCRVVARLP